MVFHWAEQPAGTDEDEVPDDEVELLVIQAWRTDTEGELLGVLFGKVGKNHLELITGEVLVFLTQLLDDLSQNILSRCDEHPTPIALTRVLELHLLWSPCLEIDADYRYYPSTGNYLVVDDITDLSVWHPIGVRREEAGEEEEEEEEESSRTDSGDPDYIESRESGSGEQDSSSEQSREEDEVTAQKRREKAEGKRPVN
ncbi:hypothetical protein CBR_g36484 [Chara braunii]|uniref:Uncharacterized protein n=1 Tax=Chara braunii TaxID=69332 RepID=A0A388LKW2_CHABU|nr:hypothetical protein CBR_g36484 [Chara braunii]|eukprot:GBG82958.1 hypothetical protein CBR_g36484 [Chara braunii]